MVEPFNGRDLTELLIRRALFECVDKLGGQVTVNAEDLDYHNYALTVKILDDPLRMVITAVSDTYAREILDKGEET